MGRIVALSVSPARGTRKSNVPSVRLVAGEGLLGDAHAGPGRRQVSLLAVESIERMRALGLDVGPGDFAENITTAGIDLRGLTPGTRLRAEARGCEQGPEAEDQRLHGSRG